MTNEDTYYFSFFYYLKRTLKWKPKSTIAWHFLILFFGALICKLFETFGG